VLGSFCDTSYAPDILCEDEKLNSLDGYYSITGYLVFYRGKLFNWGMSKQNIIATSSMAAEVKAVCDNLDKFQIPRDLLLKIFWEEVVNMI